MHSSDCAALIGATCLRSTRGNVAETARALGISRSTLYVKLQRYQLVPERPCR
ncbi:helix-turn-helix domain-containing protein [Methylolobus aquaticus]